MVVKVGMVVVAVGMAIRAATEVTWGERVAAREGA